MAPHDKYCCLHVKKTLKGIGHFCGTLSCAGNEGFSNITINIIDLDNLCKVGKFAQMSATMETMVSMPVKLTGNAVAEVKRLMQEPGFDASQYLRIGVKGGGCSGMSYVLGFDAKEEDDDAFEIEGVPVVMKKPHGIYLFGMEVDHEDGLNARGFVFRNPNASSTCGCGSSFAV